MVLTRLGGYATYATQSTFKMISYFFLIFGQFLSIQKEQGNVETHRLVYTHCLIRIVSHSKPNFSTFHCSILLCVAYFRYLMGNCILAC